MRWADCARNTDYQVSDTGLVRRVKTGKILKPVQNWSNGGRRPGYLMVSLGQVKNCYVHQLVAEAFLGPRPSPQHDVDHIDKDRFNNAVENLRYLHQSQNRMKWVGPGRHDFVVAKHETPEDAYTPMTQQEEEQLMDELEANGWHG